MSGGMLMLFRLVHVLAGAFWFGAAEVSTG